MQTLLRISFILLTVNLFAQNPTFEWSIPGDNNYSPNDIEICGAQRTVDLRVAWENDPLCPYSGWGANRYRLNVTLEKDNVIISRRQIPSSSCWSYDYYYNFDVTPGIYRAIVSLEVRGRWWRWDTEWTSSEDIIIVRSLPSSPALEVNGQTPDPEVPIEVCPGNITINPSGTDCETKYWIGVWEFDFVNWNRPREYEWGKWFEGEAPSNLNLQELSARWSTGSDFLGTDTNRQGEILFGGQLANNVPRHYRVEVCIDNPAWECAAAIIKVKCDCP